MDDGYSRIIGIHFIINKGCLQCMYVNKAVQHGFLFLLGRSVAAAGCRGGLSQPPLFPQPSRFHRNKTTHPQQPPLTDCTTILNLQRPLASDTIHLAHNVSFLPSVDQSTDSSTNPPRHLSVEETSTSQQKNQQPTTRQHHLGTSSGGRSTSTTVLIDSARRPTLAGLPANTSQSLFICQPSEFTPNSQ